MLNYKLTYFDIEGIAEPIRFLLSYANIKFIDERIKEENWLKVKKDMPFGQVPVIEVDGKKINQSTAICRYLAKRCGLNGTNDWEDLEIDATVDTITDLRTKINAAYYEKNQESKAHKMILAREVTKIVINRLDEQVNRNNGYLVGNKLTWADLVFVAQLNLLNDRSDRDIIEGAKNLENLKIKVLQIPSIKAWIDKRPKI